LYFTAKRLEINSPGLKVWSKVEEERKGLAANRLLAELRHLLDVLFLSGHVADLYGFFAWR
jgi:hypothetical protein